MMTDRSTLNRFVFVSTNGRSICFAMPENKQQMEIDKNAGRGNAGSLVRAFFRTV